MKLWRAALALALATCTKPPSPAPTPPAPVAASPGPEPAPPRTESPRGDSDAGSDAAPAGPKSDPNRFACGSTSCASGSETCCIASSDVVCLPSSRDGAYGTIGFLRDQFEACDKAPYAHGYSMSGISRCDESIDCGAHEICCDENLFSGGTINLCVPSNPTGASPCEWGEPCVDGSPCRVPGTECLGGYCIKPVKRMRCGPTELCADGESCCNEPLSCRPDAECDGRLPRIGCTRPADCVAGHECVYSETSGSYCTGHADLVTPNWFHERGLTLLCERDADCRAKCPRDAKMRCKQAKIPWLRGCVCP